MSRSPPWAALATVCLIGAGLLVAAAEAPEPAATAPVAAPVASAAADPAAEAFGLEHWTFSPSALRGRAVYERCCIGCHGPQGLGDGPAAGWLDPRPRNFQKGAFKFRPTPSGELPLLEDIVHVVNCGLNGSAMRSFPLLPEPSKNDVAAYVLSLAEFGLVKQEVDDVMEDDDLSLQEVLDDEYEELKAEVLEYAYELVWPVSMERRPTMNSASVERGRVLYEAQCTACHGATGVGDGPSSFHLRDWKDAPIRPRDFTTGVFRAGSRPEDIFMRMRTGLNGTPMPAVAGSDADLWDITHYLMSLVDTSRPRVVHPASCEAHDASRSTDR